MENILSYIENATNTSNLKEKSWKEIVDTVVLPKMAGPRGTRWCIHDNFMNFVAEYADIIAKKDSYTAMAMFEVAMQRLSCGAVLHEGTPWPEPLPREYWDYSSKWDEAHVMTEGCYNFIMKGLEACLAIPAIKSHALAILFGLTEHLSPKSLMASGYFAVSYMPSEFMEREDKLYHRAEALAEEYATFDELYRHYAQPGQWRKHKAWFAKNQSGLNWKKFFADTQTIKGNAFQRWRQRRALKKEILG